MARSSGNPLATPPGASMTPERLYLTKSRYLAGLQCRKRLWLQVHEPMTYEAPPPGSRLDLGREVGEVARRMFPGGALVAAASWQHAQACLDTARLVADPLVPAIFEAAFEAGNIRIRVDILERLAKGRWGLREVKMSTGIKDPHLDDLAVQLHVLRACGLDVASVEHVHIDTDYVRGADGIDVDALFAREECMDTVDRRCEGVAAAAAGFQALLLQRDAPDVAASPHCDVPHRCEYWDRCTAGYPEDWVIHLPGMRPPLRDALAARGVTRIGDIPDDLKLTDVQARARMAVRQGGLVVEPKLAAVAAKLAAPILFLDFETLGPPIPLYPGTRPFEPIPVQWSLHIDSGAGPLRHRAFLADDRGDPRRAFAESLLAALDAEIGSIAVYSSFEAQQLNRLARLFPDLAPRLRAAVARLIDLLPIVRAHVAHPDFRGSFSIKAVAPILSPGITYDDLDDIRDGEQASGALYLLAAGRIASAAARDRLRSALERYCARDTEALAALAGSLLRLAAPRS